MKAWLKRIDLDTFASTLLELPEGAQSVNVGRTPEREIVINSPHVSRWHCRIASDGGLWRVEDLKSTGGTLVNGHRVARHVLAHGDVISLHGTLLVFLDRPEYRDEALERRLDADPDHAANVHVWADWLLEHGDPLGEGLIAGHPGPAAFEGLQPLLDDGRLEVVLKHGLVHTVRIRCTGDSTYQDTEVLARVLSLRIARWLRELTVDLSTWSVPSPRRLQGDAAAVLKGVLTANFAPTLRRLSLGYLTQALPPSTFVDSLIRRLPKRFPHLETPAEAILPVIRHAWLEVQHVPDGLDFAHDGLPTDRRLPIHTGLWVGSSKADRLRAIAPGVDREGLVTSFIIRQQSPQWCLIPLEHGVALNGHRAVPTRLLPGDVIEDLRGMRYLFDVT